MRDFLCVALFTLAMGGWLWARSARRRESTERNEFKAYVNRLTGVVGDE